MSVLRIVVGIVVTLIWAGAWTTAILTGDYSGIGAITPVMLLVVGALYGGEAFALLRKVNGKDDDG